MSGFLDGFLPALAVPTDDPVAAALGHAHSVVIHGKAAPVLAIDIGTSMGWALRGSGYVASGAKSFAERSRESRGDRLMRFDNWLSSMNRNPLSLIAYEHVAAHGPGQVYAAHAYGQFEAVLLMWATRHAVPTRTINVSTLKKFITGRGNAKKPEVGAAVRALGFNPASDDEADALAILHWATGVRP